MPLAAPVAFGSLTVALWFGFSHAPRERGDALAAWERDLTSRADVRLAALDLWAERSLADAQTVASFPSVAALAEGRGTVDMRLGEIVSSFATLHGYERAIVVGADGSKLLGVSPLEEAGQRLAREVQASGRPAAAIYREAGEVRVAFAAEVAGAAAVLLVARAEAWLYPFLRMHRPPIASGDVVLVMRDADQVVYASSVRRGPGEPFTLRQPIAGGELAAGDALAGRTGVSEYLDHAGVPVLVATRRLSSTGWGLLIKVDQEEILEPVRRRLREEALAWGLALLALLAAGFATAEAHHRKAQAGVLEGRARVADLLEQANDAIFLISMEGRLLEANLRATELYGWAREDLLQLGVADLCAPEARSSDRHDVAEVLRLKQRVFEARHRRRDGTPFEAEISARVVSWGQTTGVLSVVRDISDRRAAEARARAAEERLRAFMENLPGLANIKDADSRYVYVNPAMAALLGRGVEALVGQRAEDGMQGPLVGHDRNLDEQVLAAGAPVTAVIETAGAERAFISTKFLLRLADGRPAVGSVALDITPQRRAELEVRRLNTELERRVQARTAQLENTNRELEAFSYSVSHDLRAPLRAVDGFARLLEEDYESRLDDEGRRLLGVIRGSARQMGQLIDDLLAFSRAGRHELRPGRVDMTALARAVWAELAPPPAGGEPAPVLSLAELPDAWADGSLVRQVWRNLLCNALKFSAVRRPARVAIEADRREVGAVYHVRDNGVGFDMRYAHKLFGVFQRLHGAHEFEGTGVGLAIVQRIVARHGGEVGAASSPGQGADFWFSLPVPTREDS